MPLVTNPNVQLLLRQNVMAFLTDTCDVVTELRTPTQNGNFTSSWVVAEGSQRIPCRIEQIQFRSQQIEVYDEKVIILVIFKIYFPFDAPVAINRKVRINGGQVYQARVLDDDMSPHNPKDTHYNFSTGDFSKIQAGIYKMGHYARID